jgi:hypothetical protein
MYKLRLPDMNKNWSTRFPMFGMGNQFTDGHVLPSDNSRNLEQGEPTMAENAKPAEDKNAREAIERVDKPGGDTGDHPAAGPHAKDHLTDKDKTPGTGALSDADSREIDAGSG